METYFPTKTMNQFISLEMLAQIEQAAQNGCLYSQTQLEELTKAQTDEKVMVTQFATGAD